jgi:hypothetical protein
MAFCKPLRILQSCDSGVDALSQEQWLQEGVKHSNCLSLAKHGAGPKRGGMDMKPNPQEKLDLLGMLHRGIVSN